VIRGVALHPTAFIAGKAAKEHTVCSLYKASNFMLRVNEHFMFAKHFTIQKAKYNTHMGISRCLRGIIAGVHCAPVFSVSSLHESIKNDPLCAGRKGVKKHEKTNQVAYLFRHITAAKAFICRVA
jgi:hypothetical protein